MKSVTQLSDLDNVKFTVKQFIDKVEKEFNKIKLQQDYGKLIRDRGRNRTIKKFIEELLPLQNYLVCRQNNGIIDETIRWKNGNQKGDALLNENEIIEITIAEHENEWIVREHMNRGNPTFCAEGTSKQKGITCSIPVVKSPQDRIHVHTKMIINAIKKKIEKFNTIDSLVIFLNQDGLLTEDEFKDIIDNVKAFTFSKAINNLFIWSFQYNTLLNKNGITIVSS
jgi:hypothetical protein